MAFSWTICAVVAVIGFIAYRQLTSFRRRNLPPGPRPLPLLGNINDLPPNGELEYRHWLKHKDIYGGVSSVTVLGMTLVLIHDNRAAHELLDQASSRTSGRPSMTMANKLCGYESIVLCQGYSPTFRRCRKYLHKELGSKGAAARFCASQEIEVKRQLVRALEEPGRWLEHLKTTAAATVLQIAYGYTIEPKQSDVLVGLIDQMMTEFSQAAVPMAWAVDVIPALRHLPASFPGATFHRTARRWRRSIQASAYIPYRFVRRQMAALVNRESYVSRLTEQLAEESPDKKLSGEDEEAVIWTAASLYGAAADTTVITLTVFTLAMIKFPHVQRKAHEEIDRVVGPNRLPNLGDREKLPYIDGVVKEAMRWWPIAPLGFPHLTTEDISYNGHDIPKGAFFLPAVWWFLHNPSVYPDPEDFVPERYMTPRNEPDPSSEAFGYGRRMCPGRFFADTSLFLNVAQSLAVFSFKKKMGADGKEIEVNAKPQPGILTYPTKFEYSIEPRSENHVELIKAAGREHPFEASDAGQLDSIEDFEVMY